MLDAKDLETRIVITVSQFCGGNLSRWALVDEALDRARVRLAEIGNAPLYAGEEELMKTTLKKEQQNEG